MDHGSFGFVSIILPKALGFGVGEGEMISKRVLLKKKKIEVSEPLK